MGFGSVAAILVVGIVGYLVFQQRIARLRFGMAMFSGAEMVEPFRSMAEIFPFTLIEKSGEPDPLRIGEPIDLPRTYVYRGQEKDLDAFLQETDTTGLLVVKDDRVVFEKQYRGNVPSSRTISWSVGKSLVSALVGIALHEGQIESVEAPITRYVPELKGSAYDGVRIKDVLQMSSGASWNEDYSDPDSDINRFGRYIATGGSLDEFTATLEREHEPGTFNRYNSADTQALGMLLKRATGISPSRYLEEKIWQPLGMEADAYWLTDDSGTELAFGGLNVALRDYARFGLLYLHDGVWKGEQIVPAEWVKASVTPDAPHLLPGENPRSDFPLGYGFQWWIMDGNEGEYSAIGVYNQFIYVNPTRRLVIVKTSANSEYGTTDEESSYRELETIELFRAIGDTI
jgi:CubicO group peptidase (beta-lactamase class C family)